VLGRVASRNGASRGTGRPGASTGPASSGLLAPADSSGGRRSSDSPATSTCRKSAGRGRRLCDGRIDEPGPRSRSAGRLKLSRSGRPEHRLHVDIEEGHDGPVLTSSSYVIATLQDERLELLRAPRSSRRPGSFTIYLSKAPGKDRLTSATWSSTELSRRAPAPYARLAGRDRGMAARRTRAAHAGHVGPSTVHSTSSFEPGRLRAPAPLRRGAIACFRMGPPADRRPPARPWRPPTKTGPRRAIDDRRDSRAGGPAR